MTTFATGIKPTGPARLGNYLGAMRPALSLSEGQPLFCSVADYHAFTTPQDPARLWAHTYDLAAAWLAAGPRASARGCGSAGHTRAVLYRVV